MEFAHSPHCVTGFELDVPVSTCNKLFDCLFENFISIVLNWHQFVRSQIVLVVSALGDPKLRSRSAMGALLIRENREIVLPKLIFPRCQLGDLLIDFMRLFIII